MVVGTDKRARERTFTETDRVYKFLEKEKSGYLAGYIHYPDIGFCLVSSSS